MTCSVAGCTRTDTRVGLCNAHYLRQWRHGSATAGGIMRGEAREFIEAHVNHTGDECVLWPYARNKAGYGDINHPSVEGLVHRVMCILAHGDPILSDDEAAHSCGNGHNGCINPKHLSWKSRLDNIHDKAEHGTQLWGAGVHFAKLTLEQARAIKTSTEPAPVLASRYGVGPGTVYNIRQNRTWKGI